MKRDCPAFDVQAAGPTRDALHGYARTLGDCLKRSRSKRKHWWHASLRPSLNGLTTGVIHAKRDYELELDFQASALNIRVAGGAEHSEALNGQSVGTLEAVIEHVLTDFGVGQAPRHSDDNQRDKPADFADYSPRQAALMGRILADVSSCMVALRATVREESSPIQLWPHHFDLSMLWLPGDKIADQDPDNEEYADKQMNFGFAFGDEGIAEPYFYITAYPLADAFPKAILPSGAQWKSDGFSGAVLTYMRLREEADPAASLLNLWHTLHNVGKASLMNSN